MEETFDLDPYEKMPDINAGYVLSQIDDLLIFKYYLGDFKLGIKIKSPLRKDGHLYVTLGPKEFTLRYKDWVTGDAGDCFKFVAQLKGISYKEAIYQIACDFGLVKGCSIVTKKQIQEALALKDQAQQEYKIVIDVRKMSSAELAYWAQYSISREELKANGIYAIQNMWVNDKQRHLGGGLHFAYHFPDIGKFKIYSPDSKEMKWFGNVSAFTMEGLPGISVMKYPGDGSERPGDPIIITKSRKDRVILKKLYHNVCSCQNEAETAIPKEMDEVFNMAESKYCWFDSDEPGKTANRKLNHRGYKWINVPNDLYEQHGLKDPADVVKHFGWEEGSKILINELKKKEIL